MKCHLIHRLAEEHRMRKNCSVIVRCGHTRSLVSFLCPDPVHRIAHLASSCAKSHHALLYHQTEWTTPRAPNHILEPQNVPK